MRAVVNIADGAFTLMLGCFAAIIQAIVELREILTVL